MIKMKGMLWRSWGPKASPFPISRVNTCLVSGNLRRYNMRKSLLMARVSATAVLTVIGHPARSNLREQGMISAHSLGGYIHHAEEGMVVGVLHNWSHCRHMRRR